MRYLEVISIFIPSWWRSMPEPRRVVAFVGFRHSYVDLLSPA